ncbi:hypothetical protein SUGI_0447870 [Cryptomeria japonica]|uniref:putative UPF0481 protein At3g02645 n=1 Tax=Cryptomeria japonica TaxID=3369 RepID=UPI002408E59F|nr:putative UPF0481 protein At3g02645 [Cryptomeria japonica]GLJ23649.1 hypothetical protein SUGI_0447870 [Cryptomeria japonica]
MASMRYSEVPTEDIRQGEWLIHIKQGLQDHQSIARPSTVTIFNVPKILVDLKRDSYLPRVVSIGRCYHQATDLYGMDAHKLRAAQRMIKRLPGKTDINSVLSEIEKMDGQIRDRYEKIINCNSETLAWMMLLDGSFLLELLRTLAGKDQNDSSDGMYFEPLFDESRIKSMGFAALGDIVKLENQIPLLVLDKILQLESGSEKEAQTKLFEFLLNAASSFFPFKYLQLSRIEIDSPFLCREHFLGFLHGVTLSFFAGTESASPTSSSSSSSSSTVERQFNYAIPSISRLSKAGICIRPYTEDGGMALRFDKETSVLYLPVLTISENTETVLRNLMAMEAFLPSELQVVSCYVGLMNSLIFTDNDVRQLRMAGILYFYVGSDAQVAQLWDSLCKGMAISSLQSLKTLKREITSDYRSKWRAKLVDFFITRFTRPWRTAISVLAATLILLFTFAQTFSSMYGFHKAN